MVLSRILHQVFNDVQDIEQLIARLLVQDLLPVSLDLILDTFQLYNLLENLRRRRQVVYELLSHVRQPLSIVEETEEGLKLLSVLEEEVAWQQLVVCEFFLLLGVDYQIAADVFLG